MKKIKSFSPLKNSFAILMLLFAFSACDKDRVAEETPKCNEVLRADCVCTADYNPVCGCNNVTYSNSCTANCAGITEFKQGECPK